jgi:hypothetical protein
MKRDYKQFPRNPNGEVLWALRTSGDALTEPREIDFSAIFPSRNAASEFAGFFGKKHRVELLRLKKQDQPDGFPWHVLVYLHEVPRHTTITAFEASLKKQAAPLGGRTWGWSSTFVPSTSPSVVKELWWSYLARDPDDGLPGSMKLNLGLNIHAPMRVLPHLLMTSVSYESNRKKPELKLPSRTDLESLHRLNDKRVTLVMSRTEAVYAGSYTHANRYVDYFYVADPRGIEAALKKFHQKECPGRQVGFKTQRDPKWKCYLEWMYPNEATIEHYRGELQKLGAI